MITVKNAIDSVRKAYPNETIADAIKLDNGYFIFVENQKIGAAGIFVDQETGKAEYAPLSFLAQHDTLPNNQVAI